MHITVFCPHCQSRYQLDPSLRGKRMRCPNTICRTVFEVQDEAEVVPPASPPPVAVVAEPAAPKKPMATGTVADILPVLPAEIAVSPERNAEPEAAPPAPPTLVPPPVRRVPPRKVEPPSIPPPPPTVAAEKEPVEIPDDLGIPGDDVAEPAMGEPALPREVGPGAWEAPPVRAPAARDQEPTPDFVPANSTFPQPVAAPPVKRSRRRSLLLIFAMLLFLGAVLGGGVFLISGRGAENEAERFQRARELYKNQEFEEAMGALQKLIRDFPKSPNRSQYDFLVELSAVREAAYAPLPQEEERVAALDRVLQFLDIYKNDALLKDYHGDVWNTLQKLASTLTALAEQKPEPAGARALLDRARRAWGEAAKFTPPAGARAVDAAKEVNDEFARLDKVLAARAARLELIEELRDLVARGSAESVRAGRRLAKDAGLAADSEVAPLLEELVKAHRARVVFTPAPAGSSAGPRPPPSEDQLPSFYVAPQVGKPAAGRRPGGVVLAQARGLLYALDAAGRDVRWVRRVGVDTSVLPSRVPASVLGPEMALVLSSDSKSLSAIAVESGRVLWQHLLDDVCLGQPVLVDRHLLVPTLSGRVHEIETTGGVSQGFYSLGQPLLVGGVRQPGTSFVIFPADSDSVYVLDVAKRVCAAILYTGHAPGSVRGLPLVWSEATGGHDSAKSQGWLLLTHASGARGVEMLPYALPIGQPDQKPAEPRLSVRGEVWAAPWHDSGRLAVATDAGLLHLYGIRQPGNRDPLLFPLLKDGYRVAPADRRAPALVVHADAENYWVLSAGKLHRLQATFTAGSGPGLVDRWPQPPAFGSPLQAGQALVDDAGRTFLTLVTQDAGQPTCWARTVEADSGKVLWRRRLGLVCVDQPASAGHSLLATDADGVFLFDAEHLPAKTAFAPGSWQPAGKLLDGIKSGTGHWTLARGDGFVHLTWGPGPLVNVHLIDPKGQVTHKAHPLPAPPHGTPALGSDFVLLALANGVVVRVPLGEGAPLNGPDWRGVGVEETQPGHIVALGNDDFAITDGGRALLAIHWADAKSWEKTGEAEMSFRITAAPAVTDRRLLVADAADSVTMLEGERLAPSRRWSLGGKITAGPFVRGAHAGVVVGNKRLVWLDLKKDGQPAWEFSFVAPIVGAPELVDGLVVVADLQGGIIGLDPATGHPAGPGYRLKANEATTAAPMAFGPDQLFLPLMDGSIMLLPSSRLR